MRSMFHRNPPVSVKPRIDLDLFRWFLKFASCCNPRDMETGAEARKALLNSSRTLFDQLLEAEGLECEWEPRGSLFVYRTASGFDGYGKLVPLIRELGVKVEPLTGKELTAREPALRDDLAGGWYHKDDAHLRPDRLMVGLRETLISQGVQVIENCEVKSFQGENGRAAAAVTDRGEMGADAFVMATGAWTPFLSAAMGRRLPIQPGKGYSITMSRPGLCPVHPCFLQEVKVAATPWPSGFRLGSTMEFAGYDTSVRPGRIRALTRGARKYLKEPEGEVVEEEWYGWRPMTYDGVPFIDVSPVLENVMIAAGHNMVGLSMGPGTGKLIAELLCNEPPHIDPRPYAMTGRF